MQWRDLPADVHLALTVWEITVGMSGRHAKAGAMFKLFSRKGRLKAARHAVSLHAGAAADVACPTHTPGKVPLAQRGEPG